MSKENLNSKSIKKQLEVIEIKDIKIPVFVPIHVQEQMKYLCAMSKKNEWSGVLFYTVEGTISDPSKMVVNLEQICTMDFGSSGMTEYELDESIISFRMKFKDSKKWKMGHVHSHNVMDTFFSGTDIDELKDNAQFHNYYVSIVTNNYEEIIGKVAMIATPKVENYFGKTENGNQFPLPQNLQLPEVLVTYNCKITLEEQKFVVGDAFIQQTKAKEKECKIRDRKKQEKAQNAKKFATQQNSKYQQPVWQNRGWDDYYDDDYYNSWNTPISTEKKQESTKIEIDTDSFGNREYFENFIKDWLFSCEEGNTPKDDLEIIFKTLDEKSEKYQVDLYHAITGNFDNLFKAYWGIRNLTGADIEYIYNKMVDILDEYSVNYAFPNDLVEFIWTGITEEE